MQNFNISVLQMALFLYIFINPLLFQFLNIHIMKLTLFLCALVLSLHGRCASLTPSQPPAGAVRPGNVTVEKEKLNIETNSPLPLDKMGGVMIACGLLTYLTVIFWWTISARNSLDKILRNILQDIARYSS